MISLFYLVLLCSLWLWQSGLFAFQILAQCFLSILIVAKWRREQKVDRKSCGDSILSLDEEGQINQLTDKKMIPHQLMKSSLVSPYFVWLNLNASTVSPKSKWQLIFRDQVNETDFRRLCRIAIRQKANKQVAN